MQPPLSVKQAAERYGLKVRTIRHWYTTGRLQRVQVGRSVYIRPETLERLLADSEGSHERNHLATAEPQP